MLTLREIRYSGEQRIITLLDRLNADHQKRVEAALRQYGSFGAVPTAFWDEVRRDYMRTAHNIDGDRETLITLVLLLILSGDEWTGEAMIRQGLKSGDVAIDDLSMYGIISTAEAEQLAQDLANEMIDELQNTVDTVFGDDEGIGKLAVKVKSHAASPHVRRTVVRATTVGQIGAMDRVDRRIAAGRVQYPAGREFVPPEPARGGVSSVIQQRPVRIERIWRNRPDLSRTGPCPICEPLDGQPGSVWGLQFPYGPPSPHRGCVCEIEPLVVFLDDDDGEEGF